MSIALGKCLGTVGPRSRRHTKQLRKTRDMHDNRGLTLVRCNVCKTWECRLDNLASHVKKRHPELWKKGANRSQFVSSADAPELEASRGAKQDP